MGLCYNAGARHRVGAVEHRALDAGTRLDFSLVYLGLESSVTQAHIHIGQTSVNGGIVLFFRAEARTSDNVPRAAPRFFDKSRRMTAAGQFGPIQDLSLPVRAFNLPM